MSVKLNSLEAIVNHYCAEKRRAAARELQFFAIQRTLADALRCAGRAEGPSGKRLKHQRRIPSRVLSKAVRRLESAEEIISKSRDFEELHLKIDRLIRPIFGIGELTVYDTALRIGAYLRLEPETVYLHAGTRDGAKALGINGSHKTVRAGELPKPIGRLRPREIEDCLCIYKVAIRKLASPAARRRVKHRATTDYRQVSECH